MARRNDHSKEELKALILDSARDIVEKNGYEALSARNLAKKISYTPGTIYIFFKNIDELIMHINACTLDQLHKCLLDESLKTSSPEKKLKNFADCYIEFSLSNEKIWRLLLDYRYKNADILPEWYQEKIKRIFNVIEDPILELGKSKKESQILAKVLWASFHGILVLAFSSKLDTTQKLSLEEMKKTLLKNYIKGLKTN